MSKKKRLKNNNIETNLKNSKEFQAKKRIIKMILFVGLIQSIGHIPHSTKYIKELESNRCLEESVNLLYILYIDSYFFIYIYFNNKLIKVFKKIFLNARNE